ncbi:MAG: hypothetical protein PHQ60_15700 [Sideroxydans sp.]|nr:hypothetical protein [Sideroxydans sp.]
MSRKRYSARLFTLDWPEAEAASKDLLRLAMVDMVQVVYAEAEERVPRGRGRSSSKSLISKLGTRLEKGGEVGVVWDKARHAYLVHEGASPHAIPKAGRPRRAKHLAIPSSAGPLFRQSARHPGTKGQPFLRDALKESRQELNRLLAQKGEEYLKGSLG